MSLLSRSLGKCVSAQATETDTDFIGVDVVGSSSPGGSHNKLCIKAEKLQMHKNDYAML